MKEKRERKEEIDKKKIVKKKTITKKKDFINKKQLTIKEENKDIEKPRINFNLITGIMIFVLLIGASFSISIVFGIAFSFCFILSFYNKILEKKPFLPLILFLIGLTIRVIFIWFLPSVFESAIYLDLIISFTILVIIFLMSFKIKELKHNNS